MSIFMIMHTLTFDDIGYTCFDGLLINVLLIICPDFDSINYDNSINQIKSGLHVFGGGCIRLGRIKTNNLKRIIINLSKQVQPSKEKIK